MPVIAARTCVITVHIDMRRRYERRWPADPARSARVRRAVRLATAEAVTRVRTCSDASAAASCCSARAACAAYRPCLCQCRATPGISGTAVGPRRDVRRSAVLVPGTATHVGARRCSSPSGLLHRGHRPSTRSIIGYASAVPRDDTTVVRHLRPYLESRSPSATARASSPSDSIEVCSNGPRRGGAGVG